jgi:hypothetical protein
LKIKHLLFGQIGSERLHVCSGVRGFADVSMHKLNGCKGDLPEHFVFGGQFNPHGPPHKGTPGMFGQLAGEGRAAPL